MIIGAMIPVEWAIFFTEVVALLVLFIAVRKMVFYLSGHFFGKDDR